MVLDIGNWVRDDLPDLLWPVLVVSEMGHDGIRNMVDWQRSVLADLKGKATPIVLSDGLDGRLTSLERLGNAVPKARKSCRARAVEHGLLPSHIENALNSYPFRPAAWFTEGEAKAPSQADIDLLVHALTDVIADDHHEALVKCLPIWGGVVAKTLTTNKMTIELLAPYPNDSATRDAADSAVRSMWGASRGARLHNDPDYYEPSLKWARVFWGANSMTTRCLRERDYDDETTEEKSMPDTESDKSEESPTSDASESATHTAPSAMPDGGGHLREFAMDLLSSYVEALETSPANLYHHERQEVHSGLVARAGRDVITALGVPDLWCAEHGSHITRALVEARILLRWMSKQDVGIYKQYQDFGFGKAKLYAKILDEIPEDARREAFSSIVDELRKLSHNDDVLDYRDVDTSDSFSGKSIRAMAQEAGLIDFYRQLYYMASGVSHSEWWSIETHAMERCRNILHGGHLIPSLSLNSAANLELARAWINLLYTIMRESLDLLGTDEDAINSAFAWMRDGTDNADEDDSTA